MARKTIHMPDGKIIHRPVSILTNGAIYTKHESKLYLIIEASNLDEQGQPQYFCIGEAILITVEAIEMLGQVKQSIGNINHILKAIGV